MCCTPNRGTEPLSGTQWEISCPTENAAFTVQDNRVGGVGTIQYTSHFTGGTFTFLSRGMALGRRKWNARLDYSDHHRAVRAGQWYEHARGIRGERKYERHL